jgi:hypothetical protein
VNLADKIVMRPLASLVPYSSNARTHTPAQINLIDDVSNVLLSRSKNRKT